MWELFGNYELIKNHGKYFKNRFSIDKKFKEIVKINKSFPLAAEK